MDNRDLWLGERLIELAESAGDGDGNAASAEQLTASLAELLAPAELGLLLSTEAGGIAVGAATTSRASDLASLEAQAGEGPCTDCIALAQPVFNEVTEPTASRWPVFGAAASAAGFGVVSALPLLARRKVLGAVSVLTNEKWHLRGSDLYFADILTRAAAVAIVHQRELSAQIRTAGQLQRALDSRVIIEQAKGATAARLGITPDAAFDLLRAYARAESRTLADVARRTVLGELPAHHLFARRHADPRQRLRAGRPNSG